MLWVVVSEPSIVLNIVEWSICGNGRLGRFYYNVFNAYILYNVYNLYDALYILLLYILYTYTAFITHSMYIILIDPEMTFRWGLYSTIRPTWATPEPQYDPLYPYIVYEFRTCTIGGVLTNAGPFVRLSCPVCAREIRLANCDS